MVGSAQTTLHIHVHQCQPIGQLDPVGVLHLTYASHTCCKGNGPIPAHPHYIVGFNSIDRIPENRPQIIAVKYWFPGERAWRMVIHSIYAIIFRSLVRTSIYNAATNQRKNRLKTSWLLNPRTYDDYDNTRNGQREERKRYTAVGKPRAFSRTAQEHVDTKDDWWKVSRRGRYGVI